MSASRSTQGPAASASDRGVRRWLPSAAVRFARALAVVCALGPAVYGGHLQGRVTDAEDGAWLEGARIELDLLVDGAGDGIAEYAAEADLFGFYRLRDVPAGDYAIRAVLRGYEPVAGTLAIAGADGQDHPIAMTRDGAGALFPLWFQVNCVKTGKPLVGVTVVARRHSLVGGDFQEEMGGVTDDAGHVELLNMQAGKYHFAINPAGAGQVPGWESYATAEMATVGGAHLANVQLKPVEQSITVTVRGFDPVTETENALLSKVYVEATGLDADAAAERVLIPTITAVSKLPATVGVADPEAGKAWFTKLCPATWRIRGKRHGYAMQEHCIVAAANTGVLEQDTLEISMPLNDTVLEVMLAPPEYYPATALHGATVRLEGLKSTHTEGICREVAAAVLERRDGTLAVASFTRILPGSYEISLHETVTVEVPIVVEGENVYPYSPRSYQAEFSGSSFVEATDDETSVVELALTPTPVRADFALHVAERMIEFNERKMSNRPTGYAREFLPRSGQVVAVRMSDYMVPEGTRAELPEFAATTDEHGRFSVTVPPGLYGVRVDDMPGYWGMQTLRSSKDARAETPDWEGSVYEEAWPYAGRWTHSADRLDQWPNNYYFGAGGMSLDSGRVYETVLQVGRNLMPHFRYDVKDFYKTPFKLVATAAPESAEAQKVDYFLSQRGTPATVTLTETARRATHTVPVEVTKDGTLAAIFTNLPPGRYRPSADHADLVLYDSYNHNDIEIFDCPEPGHVPAHEIPDCEAAGVDVRYPFDYWQQDELHLCYAHSAQCREFNVRLWDMELGVYEDHWHMTEYKLLQSPDFGALHFVVHRPGEPLYVPTDRPYTLLFYSSDAGNTSRWFQTDNSRLAVAGDTATCYIGGPQANCNAAPAPQISHTLILRAQTNDSVPVGIDDGVEVQFYPMTGGRKLVAPQTVQNSTDEPKIYYATHPNWVWDRGIMSQRVVGDTLEVTSVAVMKRGLRLRVEVLNAATGQALDIARVTTRYANHVELSPNPPAPVDGWKHIFEFEHAFDAAENIVLTVRAEGYLPRIIELTPGAAVVDPDNPQQRAYLLTEGNAVRLTPLAGPAVTVAPLDRAGGFLPTVAKAGSEDGYDPEAVRAALTLTWGVSATPAVHDLPGATPGDPTRPVRDDIAEIWIVDQRSFATSLYNDDALPLHIPVNGGIRTPGVAYSLEHPERGWDYLERNVSASDRKVIYQRVRDFAAGENGTVAVTRALYLPELPPGEFAPAVAVVSKMGAVTLYEFAYGEREETTRLVGARLPPWMGTLANVFGTVANAQSQVQDAGLERFLPEGFLSPVPTFKATIAVDDSFVRYDYELGVTLSEGSDTPKAGLLGMAQGALGLEMSAALTAGFDGAQREYSLGMSGTLGAESVDPNSMCPGIADLLGVEPSLDPGPKGTLATLFSESFVGDNIPHQKKVKYSLSGSTGAKLTADLTASLNAIPYVGPVIRKVGKYVEIKCEATMKGLTGLRVTREWRTTYPRYDETGSQVVGSQPARRHFLGGKETADAQTTFDLAFNFGVGLEVSASGRVGASAEIELTGEEGWTGEPALAITSNPIGQWPVIKRIDGTLQAKLAAYLDYWVSSYEAEYVWNLLEIKHEFGTETGFQLVPVSIETRRTGRDALEPAEPLDLRPQILRGPLPHASWHAAGGCFVFIDMESAGGSQLLRVGRRDGPDGYCTPVAVPDSATAGAILAAAIAPLAGGEWLILWSRIDEACVEDPYAPATVLAATANGDLTTFGEVVTVAEMDLPVTAISPVALGEDVGCVLSVATEGPGSQRIRLDGVVRSAASSLWGPVGVLLGDADVLATTAVGTGDPAAVPAQVAYVDAEHGLWTLAWNGTAAGAAVQTVAASGCGDALAGFRACGAQWLLAAKSEHGVRCLRYDATGGAWEQTGELLDGEPCASLAGIAAGAEGRDGRILFAWASGGSVSPVCCGLLDGDGQMVSGILAVTGNPVGAYGGLALDESTPGAITLAAIFENGDVREVRTFDLDPATGTLVHDDRDGDGMQDHLELHAVDDNTADGYTLIDHILPGDDYDEDGTSNLAEYGWTYTLEYLAGLGGTIAGEATQTVAHGQDGTTVTAVPDEGYHFVQWSDGLATPARIDANVTANIAVTATFGLGENQTIDFPAIPARTYGDEDFLHGATASSGLPVTVLSSDETVATVAGEAVHIVAAGTCVLTACQAGNDAWGPAVPVQQTLAVARAPLTCTAEDKAKVAGSTNPPLTIAYAGLVNGDSAPATVPNVACAADETSGPGTYAITLDGGTDPNYELARQNGELTVHDGTTLRIWADDGGRREALLLQFGEAAEGTPLGLLDEAATATAPHLSRPAEDGAECLLRDFRPVAATTRWRLVLPAGADRAAVVLTWDATAATDDSREIYLQELRDEEAVGFPVDMRTENRREAASGSEFEIVYSVPAETVLSLDAGWNLVGSPVMSTQSAGEILGGGRDALDAGPLWWWRGLRYSVAARTDALIPERGHWLHCGVGGDTAPIAGIRADGAILLRPGWNIVSPAFGGELPEVPGVAGTVWQWDPPSGGYEPVEGRATLQVGKGYWIYNDTEELLPMHLGE